MSEEAPSGVLLVDKDPGFTSHNAVALCRRILQTKKVGHCGTLDPMATGMLIVVIGKATKMQDLLMCEDKVYTATMKLGVETNSQDADGEVVAEKPTDALSEADIRAAFEHFNGEFDQVPPMYSALKVNGKKLYELGTVVIDNCGCMGDASMRIEEIGRNVAPTSTAAGAAILNAIEARAVEMMVADGYVPEVFSSSNVDGGDEINDAYVKKYIKEIKSL